MSNNKITFTLEEEYKSKYEHLLSMTNSRDNKTLIKRFIDEFVELSEEDNNKLIMFCDKTHYCRKTFFKEAVEHYLNKIVKKYSVVRKEKNTDIEVKNYIDELITYYDNCNFEDKRYLNVNIINKYLKDKGINKNIEVIKRVYNKYKAIQEYHIKNNLKPNHNIDIALKKRQYKK